MDPKLEQLRAQVEKFNGHQIASAGARYTPGIDPGAPNIRNEDLANCFHSLVYGPEVTRRFEDFDKALKELWGRAKSACEISRNKINHKVGEISGALPAIEDALRLRKGTGKTHFLCDLTKHRGAAHRHTLLILARNFQTAGRTLEIVCRDLGAGLSPEELIAELDACGVASGERNLILIDGVNEGPRDAWSAAIAELTRLVAARNHVALVVSARTPFEEIVLSQGERDRMVSLTHAGFTDREFDAQAEFFRYYHLPLPEVPLLDEEFPRPLTLKLICEAFRDLRTRKLRDGFTGVASGQKGMTFVLEVFVNRIGADIEREFGLPAKTCWRLLKGENRVTHPRYGGFAPHMRYRSASMSVIGPRFR